MLRLHPAIRESPPRNCRGATDPCSNPGRATLFRPGERRSGGKPSGKGKDATPRLWRIRRAGEFEKARAPSAPRRPERVKTELFEEGASLRIEVSGVRFQVPVLVITCHLPPGT